MTENVRDNLKTTTKSLHKWVESADSLNILHQASIHRDDYDRLISNMYVFFHQLDPIIAEFESDFMQAGLSDIHKRLQRVSWLKEDLQHKSLDELNDLNGFSDQNVSFETLDNFSAVVGALYVCEGSTMGGMQIRPMLQKRIGENLPYCYYRGYGDDNLAMWQGFTNWLDHTEVDQKKALLGACEVFINLKTCLDN